MTKTLAELVSPRTMERLNVEMQAAQAGGARSPLEVLSQTRTRLQQQRDIARHREDVRGEREAREAIAALDEYFVRTSEHAGHRLRHAQALCEAALHARRARYG